MPWTATEFKKVFLVCVRYKEVEADCPEHIQPPLLAGAAESQGSGTRLRGVAQKQESPSLGRLMLVNRLEMLKFDAGSQSRSNHGAMPQVSHLGVDTAMHSLAY